MRHVKQRIEAIVGCQRDDTNFIEMIAKNNDSYLCIWVDETYASFPESITLSNKNDSGIRLTLECINEPNVLFIALIAIFTAELHPFAERANIF